MLLVAPPSSGHLLCVERGNRNRLVRPNRATIRRDVTLGESFDEIFEKVLAPGRSAARIGPVSRNGHPWKLKFGSFRWGSPSQRSFLWTKSQSCNCARNKAHYWFEAGSGRYDSVGRQSIAEIHGDRSIRRRRGA